MQVQTLSISCQESGLGRGLVWASAVEVSVEVWVVILKKAAPAADLGGSSKNSNES